MNLDQLYYVREVLQTNSTSIASENLNVTQSAISQSITLLEKEIGFPLFHRSRQGTFPTDVGKPILYKILEALQKIDEVYQEVQAIHGSQTGNLSIATISSLFLTAIPKVLADFQKQYSQIQLTVSELDNADVITKVQNKEVDIGFVAMLRDFNQSITQLEVFYPIKSNGFFTVIASKDSKLALKKFVTLDEIKNYPFIMYDRKLLYELLGNANKNDVNLNTVFVTSNTEVIKRSVAEGLGISIFSDLMMEDDPYVKSGEIIAIPLRMEQMERMEFGVLYKKNNSSLPLIKKFLEFVN